MKKTKFYIYLMLVLLLVSCKSTKTEDSGNDNFETENIVTENVVAEQKNTITKYPDAMLWEINGFDSNNKKSKVYILGTYHSADERSYPIPLDVEFAWNSADTIVCELSSDDWQNFQNEIDNRVNESVLVDTDRSLVDELTPDELMTVVSILGEDQTASVICYEPWVLNSMLSSILMNFCGLDFSESYDSYFINLAFQQNKTFEGLDDLQTQVDLNAYGDWNTQLLFLREQIESISNPDEAIKEIEDFYDAYLSHDEERFSKIYFDDLNELLEEDPLYEDYVKALLVDRNQKWAKKIGEYINNGGTTFIFAGCAHFIGDYSVFEIMKENGILEF